MRTVALFVPCYVDQLYPRAAIAALNVLERLDVRVIVPSSAVCCGQPPANAGFERSAVPTLARYVHTYEPYDCTVVLSGSCALHIRNHAGSLPGADGVAGSRVAHKTFEFCEFLHDEIGINAVASLNAQFQQRIGLHIGCHALRALGLAKPSELQATPFNKVRALLETVRGLTFADLRRADECCGFGGTFAVAEPAISAKMGRDRLRDYSDGGAATIVSTDMSCLMHLEGLSRAQGTSLSVMHVAEVLASTAT